jgi:very-short-patch-repair endonuclease
MKRTPAERREFVEQRAAEMAAEPTPAEMALYAIVEPLGFKRQQVIEGKTKNGGLWSYIADAYHPGFGIVVEVDGSSHRNKKGRDRRRDTRMLTEYQIAVMRFGNKDVLRNPDNVKAFIEHFLEAEPE